MKKQNIVVALPLEDELLRPLHNWGHNFEWNTSQTVHFLHIVKRTITPLEFGLMELPDEKTFQDMLPTLNKFLRDEAQKILPKEFKGELHFHVYSDFNPKEETVAFLKKIEADLIVVSTKGTHGFEGLFHSHFTDHMVKFAPCDVYVTRPHLT